MSGEGLGFLVEANIHLIITDRNNYLHDQLIDSHRKHMKQVILSPFDR